MEEHRKERCRSQFRLLFHCHFCNDVSKLILKLMLISYETLQNNFIDLVERVLGV